jgi:L-asparaginase
MSDGERSARRVTLFTLGGTIASAGASAGASGAVPALTGAQLLAAVPGLGAAGTEIDVRDFRRVAGSELTFDDVIELSHALVKAGPADGVVVTQGTDTIEETAYLLDLLYDGDAPLVVTGAMRNATLAGADGPANLLAAIAVAASPAARGLGCLVVFADDIHAARFARKAHSTSVTAFTSPDAGPLGHVVEGAVTLLTRVPRGPRLPAPPLPVTARVPVLTMALGDDGAVTGLPVDGLVVAAFGVGHVPSAVAARLQDLAARVPVILTSRTGGGSTLRATYAFPGSEADLLRRGLISGGFLDPYKARVLLRLLLANGASRDEIAKQFRRGNVA